MKEDDVAYRPLRRREWHAGSVEARTEDVVAVEAPLQIRVNGAPVAVVMRTPGHDEQLATGMLLAEGVIETLDDLRSIRHCDELETPESEGNVLHVVVPEHRLAAVEKMRRTSLTGSSCGVCGRTAIDDLLARRAALDDEVRTLAPATIIEAARALASSQPTFAKTGGVHGVGLFTREGKQLCVFEDVGRHNAVDKVVGWRLREDATEGVLLMVSGRVSFEIVQKAMSARVPVVAAVSAPTSLAVDLADACGMTLAGFVRGDRMCVYTGDERLTRAPSE
ncbi:MAG: formate dehydrogenase accessory sulfurtransferase FdhD [Nannocystaceae bacterium]